MLVKPEKTYYISAIRNSDFPYSAENNEEHVQFICYSEKSCLPRNAPLQIHHRYASKITLNVKVSVLQKHCQNMHLHEKRLTFWAKIFIFNDSLAFVTKSCITISD